MRATSLAPAATMQSQIFRTWADALAWGAVLIYLVAVPATIVWFSTSGHDYSRVMQIGVCLLCALALALRRDAALTQVSPWAAMAIGLLALIATIHAPERAWAARELALPLGLLSVSALVAYRVRQTGMTTLLAVVGVAGSTYAALTVVGLAASLTEGTTFRPLTLPIGYDNGRFFNHVQTSMLPLLALGTLHPFANRLFKRLAWFGLVMGIALLTLTEGRATGLGLVIGLAVATVFLARTSGPVLRNVAIACAMAALVYVVLYMALPRLLGVPIEDIHVKGVGDAGSAYTRFMLWRIALSYIERSPWLGIGPMHYSHTWNFEAAHPHNVYLQVAAEWGLPMLLLLLGFALVGIRALYRAVRDRGSDEAERRIGLGLLAALIAIAVDGMFSGNFVMPVSQVWIAVVIGAAAGWMNRSAKRAAAPPSRLAVVAGGGLRWVSLAAMLWLASSVAPELRHHLLGQPEAASKADDARSPRFWSNGWF